ncbi:MAG TPA: hypothetical protein VHD83_23190 [Puia sp.]|nr:hypothetical protein [Puia sp.]
MIINESQAGNYKGGTGTGFTDVMQVNVPGDWNSSKANIGLTKNQDMTPESSINAALKYLFIRGMKSGDDGVMNWRSGSGGDWTNAVEKYNTGGDPQYMPKFNANMQSMQPASASNY